jgi:two-component system chemotaxis response regulator CheY
LPSTAESNFSVTDDQTALPGFLKGCKSMAKRRQSVLVAENNRALAQTLRFHLERAGFSVYVAHDGDQAAILSARQRFDLILTDLELPLMSGKEFCRHLREDLQLTEIPLAVFSTGSKSDSEEIAFQFDIAREFSKPIDPTVVVEFAKEMAGSVTASA